MVTFLVTRFHPPCRRPLKATWVNLLGTALGFGMLAIISPSQGVFFVLGGLEKNFSTRKTSIWARKNDFQLFSLAVFSSPAGQEKISLSSEGACGQQCARFYLPKRYCSKVSSGAALYNFRDLSISEVFSISFFKYYQKWLARYNVMTLYAWH